MIRLMLILTLMAGASAAQEVTTDAFGIFPSDNLGDRENWAGLRVSLAEGATVQEAGPPSAAILFVGPKSIVAGREPGHAVAIGLDVHGNMVSGVQTQFVLGYGTTIDVTTRDGIADVLFTPPPRSGNYLAGARVGDVQTARADYRVTADLASMAPRFATEEESVLPETFGRISTEPLIDGYGNIVDDGVGLNVILEDESGRATHLPSVARDGVARSVLLARELSGEVAGELALAGASAEGLTFAVDAMIIMDAGQILIWEESTIDAIHLRVGPMGTGSGYLVPDGTAGSVDVTTADGASQRAEGWVLDGYLSFLLPLTPDSGPFDVSLAIVGNQLQRQVGLSRPPEDLNIRGAE